MAVVVKACCIQGVVRKRGRPQERKAAHLVRACFFARLPVRLTDAPFFASTSATVPPKRIGSPGEHSLAVGVSRSGRVPKLIGSPGCQCCMPSVSRDVLVGAREFGRRVLAM